MAQQYVYIDNYSGMGRMGISSYVFDQIAHSVIKQISGAEVSKRKPRSWRLHHPILTTIHNGQVNINIDVALKKNCNAQEVCLSIQEEVANALLATTELVPFKINLKVVSIE